MTPHPDDSTVKRRRTDRRGVPELAGEGMPARLARPQLVAPVLIILGVAAIVGWSAVEIQRRSAERTTARATAITATLAGSLAAWEAELTRGQAAGAGAHLRHAVGRDESVQYARLLVQRDGGRVVIAASTVDAEIEQPPPAEWSDAMVAGRPFATSATEGSDRLTVCGRPVLLNPDGTGATVYLVCSIPLTAEDRGGNSTLLYLGASAAVLLALVGWMFRDGSGVRRVRETRRDRDNLELHALFDQQGVAMALARPDGRELRTNAAMEDLLGRTPAECRDLSLFDIAHADDVDELRRLVNEMGAGGFDEFEIERRFVHADGRLVPARLVATLVRGREPGVAVLGTLLEDRSERQTLAAAATAGGGSDSRFDALFRTSAAGVGLFTTEGRAIQVNEQWARMFGNPPDERGLSLDRIHPDALFESHDKLRQLAAGAIDGFSMTDVFVRSDGTEFTGELSVAGVRPETDGERSRTVTAVAAVLVERPTDAAESETQVREAESRFRAVFELSPDALCLLDAEGRVVAHNRSAGRLFSSHVGGGDTSTSVNLRAIREGDPMLNLDRKHVLQLVHDASTQLREDLGPLADGQSVTIELRSRSRAGRLADLRLHFEPLSDLGRVTGALLHARDITSHREAERELERSNLYDALTDLPKRSLFIDRLRRALSRSKRMPDHRIALLCLDLDNFKNVNDSLGHTAGDQLLVEVARRLSDMVRSDSDDTASRLGGDEFTLLLDGLTDPSDATRIAQRILASLAQPFHINDQDVYTNVSIGIATNSPVPYETAEEMMRDADIALYRAKAAGRGQYVVFDREMHDRALRRLRLESDLQKAAERGELRLYYQPIISLLTGRIDSFEGLIRWQHPEQGMISPGEFIPVAEETGLINRVGRWVMQESCRQVKAWIEQFPDLEPLAIHINLSARQFGQPDLVEQIEEELGASGIDPALLGLEVTESALMDRPEVTRDALERLESLGCTVHIDDFGTGYSSLSYLHSFPFGTLKIDQSFVSRMRSDQASMEIIRTIIALSRSIGFEVIAEGIETVEQRDALKSLGCDHAQGYYFSRPLPAEQIAELLASNPKW